MFEKKLPMRKLTIIEWDQLISNTAPGSETMKIEELVSSLQILKGAEFWKDGEMLAQDGIFQKVL
jgi:hypothetical protein